MAYALGSRSKRELEGVSPSLINVVNRAIETTTQDFSVHDGLRTLIEQKKLYDAGASKTMRSKHLTGKAVDLVPYINGKLRWEWGPIYLIALAVRKAAVQLSVPLVWGGAWDIAFTESTDSPEELVKQYIERRRAMGKSAFLDGPHFQIEE